MKRVIHALAVVAVSVGFSLSVHAAELVVVASTAPDYKVGMVVDGNDPIRVAKGGEVTFISSAGVPLKLVGPYKGVPDTSGNRGEAGLVDALSDVIRSAPQNTASAGVMRASLFESGDPWLIDSSKAGSYCVIGSKPVMFWRAIIIGEVQASLETGGQRSRIVWAAGSHTAEWPVGLPVSDGETYQLEFTASKKLRKYTLHRVPENLPTDAHKVVWMHGKGCGIQASILLTRLQEAAKTPDQG